MGAPGPGFCSLLLSLLSLILAAVTLPISLFFCVKVSTEQFIMTTNCWCQVVQEYERAVIFRLGRLRPGGARGPGIFFVLPCIDHYKKVDLRTVTFDVPPQEVRPNISQCLTQLLCTQVLSRDSVTVTVDAVIYYRVSNPTMVTITSLSSL